MNFENYPIDCTGDVVVGDEVCFTKAVWAGSWRKPRRVGTEIIEGKVIKESYGKLKQQHTFTLELRSGRKMLIKGRNLYRNKCYRKKWANEAERQTVADEKHQRGAEAREAARYRKMLHDYDYSECDTLEEFQK